MRVKFERKKDTPKKLRTFEPKKDESWVDVEIGCNNIEPPEVLKKDV